MRIESSKSSPSFVVSALPRGAGPAAGLMPWTAAPVAGGDSSRVRSWSSLRFLTWWVPRGVSVIVMAVGGATLLGWATGTRTLTHVADGWVAMKVNTALGFILAGAALWLQRHAAISPARRRLGQTLAVLVALLGGLTLLEYGADVSLGIDQLVLTQVSGAGSDVPWARMSRAAAFSFLVLGLALAGLHARRGRQAWLVPGLAGTGLVVGLVALAGYLYRVEALHAFLPFYAMAAHTSVAFMLLAIGVLSVRTAGDPTSVVTSEWIGGVLARRLLPLALALPLVVGWAVHAAARGGAFSLDLGLALFAAAIVVGFALLIVATARWLDDNDRRRVAAEAMIRELNATLEQRVAERTAALEAANRDLESFGYSVSHDLRTPLRAVDGFSAALLEDYGPRLPAEAQGYLQRVRSGAQRMGELIDDLLALSRLSRHLIERHEVATLPLVQDVLVALAAEQAGRAVDFRLGPLPSCSADLGLLRQVWTNLLSNALKYTRGRTPAVIEVGAQPGGSAGAETVFYVRDNGTGFDMAYAHKLFGVFQRLHRAEDFEGTGVGLAIVQRIVQRHGGRVWAEAAPGAGATFFFTLGPTTPAER